MSALHGLKMSCKKNELYVKNKFIAKVSVKRGNDCTQVKRKKNQNYEINK